MAWGQPIKPPSLHPRHVLLLPLCSLHPSRTVLLSGAALHKVVWPTRSPGRMNKAAEAHAFGAQLVDRSASACFSLCVCAVSIVGGLCLCAWLSRRWDGPVRNSDRSRPISSPMRSRLARVPRLGHYHHPRRRGPYHMAVRRSSLLLLRDHP